LSFPLDCELLSPYVINKVVLFLLSGTTKLLMEQRGCSCHTLNLLGPGEMPGEISALYGLAASAHVTLIEALTCLCMPHTDFVRCVEEMPLLSLSVARNLARILRLNTSHIKRLAIRGVQARAQGNCLVLLHGTAPPTLVELRFRFV
jgi:CRP-like cAMP-binding protein